MRVSLCLFIIGILLLAMGYANQSKAMCNPQPRTTYVPPSVYDKLLEGSPSMGF